MRLYRLGCLFQRNNFHFFSKITFKIQFFLYNTSLPHTAEIASGTRFAYGGIGCVVHARAKIGTNCLLGQGITIGGRSKEYDVPIIGNNVYIGAGARILGPILIGNNSIIAPNSVVLNNVKSNSIVGGIPARLIRENINPNDYV